jgi:hypothetical protein
MRVVGSSGSMTLCSAAAADPSEQQSPAPAKSARETIELSPNSDFSR